MDKHYDYIIVGSGLFGLTCNYLLSQQGKKCLILEKRSHIGGNLYCDKKCGINIHKYGPHIFHTSNKDVWDFVTSLVEFNNFINTPIAKYNNELYNLPFNMNTFSKMFNVTTPKEVEEIIEKERYKGEITNLEEQAKSLVGETIFNKLIKEYTEKQWGKKCKELPSSIIKRLPLRFTYNNNYFSDTWQGIPKNGYNELIEKLLGDSDVLLNTDFNIFKEYYMSLGKKIIYSGKIDEFYDYCYGELEYRSVSLKTEVLNEPNHQGSAIVNYTNKDIPYTRIIEHKHFESFNDDVYKNDKTVISYEYPSQWERGKEGYYPINTKDNNTLYEKYRELSEKEEKVLFGGRLADYKYYDMDDTIEAAFKLVDIEKSST